MLKTGVVSVTKREFLKLFCFLAGTGLLGYWWLGRGDSKSEAGSVADGSEGRKEAYYYTSEEGQTLRCDLCFRSCVIEDGQTGFCRNRKNEGGTLYNLVYGLPSAVNVEPIEKEPMHHFHPGSQVLCIGTASCNFRCKFCHNWRLSQRSLDEMNRVHELGPEQVVARAQRRGAPGISFTYNEPTVFYEYMYDTSRLAKEAGLKVIFHTNGAIQEEPLRDLLNYVDAVTVDLKAFDDEFYRRICRAQKDPVLNTLQVIHQEGVWLEIVNLVLPEKNDGLDQIRSMASWIADELNPNVPLHFSRFFPSYQMTDLSPTPVRTLEACRETALNAGLRHVSVGNVPGHEANSTFCPDCGEVVVRRRHFTVQDIQIVDGKCAHCGSPIAGVWQ